MAPLFPRSSGHAGATVGLLAATECPAERSERRRTLRGFVFHQAQKLARASSEYARGVWLLVAVLGQLYRESCPTWRHAVPRRRHRSNGVSVNPGKSHSVFYRRAAPGLDDVVLWVERPVQDAPPPRTRHLPYLAVCVGDRGGRVCVLESLCLLGRDPALMGRR